jgi:rhamnogalacturonan endolyase
MTITTKILILIIFVSSLSLASMQAVSPRQMESLGRGVIAISQGEGKVFIGWRLLGGDPEAMAFNLYRATGDAGPVKLNAKPLTEVTYLLTRRLI